VALAPVSPHARGALARFLLAQGRPKEAVDQVDNAARDRGRLEFADERLLLDQTVVGAHLAVGDVAGAKAALPIDLPVELTDQVRYLEGCVAYAEGDLDKALSEFEACAAGGKVPDAALGIAACKLRQGKVVAARDAFDAVADQNPRLRHLALAGKGLALEHIDGEQAAAVEALEAALEANPQHPYVLYLLGRERRRNGDLDGAVEALKQALMRRDDLSEAHGELAVTYERLYQRDTDASALSHAVRYIDRLVASEAAALNGDRKPTILFREMQGRYHFEAGDYRGARAAFEAGRDQSDFCKIGQAIVAYKQKRYDEARDTLGELRRDLPLKHPDREFAKKLVNRMDAHDNLEQIQVTFDGQRLPKSWHTKQAGRAEGGLKPRVHAGELHIGDDRQRFRGSRPVVMAWRELPGTGRFVSLDLSFRNAGDHVPFVGLEINNRRESGGVGRQDFMARFGLNENGFLFLQILDGRNPKDVDREPLTFKHVVVHRDQLNHLRLEAVPQKGDEDNKTLFLRAWWNGEMVHERRLQRLRRATGKSSGKLNLELKVEGKNGKQVKVVFDNFRLVQIRGS
jgi:tetratricopeptide (TPR) repeat protein